MSEDIIINEGMHYVCYGGCKGVSKKPGVCQAPDCALSGHELEKCECTDGKHQSGAKATGLS